MSLDVYVGSLTHYYAGGWQKHAPAEPVAIVRADESVDEAVSSPEEIHPAILAWRDQLTHALADHVERPLDWDESDTALCFTDEPTWECYASLLLWAAYCEHPELPRPREVTEDWISDPALQRSAEPSFDSAFPQLVRDVEIWLPNDLPFVFRAPDPTGHELHIGSSAALCEELAELNRRTWNASELTLAQWRREPADYEAPLELGARFAFSIMTDLARKALAHRLVMKLDY